MVQKQIEVTCQHCQKTSEYSIDLPAESQPAAASPVDVNKAIEQTLAARDQQAEVETLKSQLAETQSQLQQWLSGELHHEFSPEAYANCPDCGPKLQTHIIGKVQEALTNLSPKQAKEIARRYKLWPPPDIELPNGLGSRKMKP
jgi:DNA repair exonuclease SbcCD ATPase subunit